MSIAPGYRGTNDIMEDFAKRNQCDNMKSLETQIGGNHYKDMKVQPLEFIMANNLSFLQGNVIKYICRYRSKNGLQDLFKARHYLDILIEHEQRRTESGDSTTGERVSREV